MELLVLGHHGSKYASSEELLNKCSGAVGVISVGYNTYGHPADSTLERAEKSLGRVFRTDEDGTIQLIPGHGDLNQWIRNRIKETISTVN